MTLALMGILLGECAIVLDIRSRVFGAYARTAPGAAKRIALVVALSIALAAPVSVLTVHPESTLVQWWAMSFGLLGAVLFLHFLFPYRWGIRRVTSQRATETCHQLTDRVVLRSVTIETEHLPPVTAHRLTIGLTHTPDCITLFPRLGVTIGLAGHTHGGRLRLPLVGPILVPSKYGRFLDSGPFRLDVSVLYIISGFGYCPSIRSPAEIVQLTVQPSPD